MDVVHFRIQNIWIWPAHEQQFLLVLILFKFKLFGDVCDSRYCTSKLPHLANGREHELMKKRMSLTFFSYTHVSYGTTQP